MDTRLIDLPTVLTMTGRSRAAVYDHINRGLFTKPCKLGKRSLWPEHEISEINRAVIAGRSEQEIRHLVRDLEAARQNAA